MCQTLTQAWPHTPHIPCTCTRSNCAPPLGYSEGCNGGDVIDVVRFMAEHGLPDEGCMPYRWGRLQ